MSHHRQSQALNVAGDLSNLEDGGSTRVRQLCEMLQCRMFCWVRGNSFWITKYLGALFHPSLQTLTPKRNGVPDGHTLGGLLRQEQCEARRVQGPKNGQWAWVPWVQDHGEARNLWVRSTPQARLTVPFPPFSGSRGWKSRGSERSPAEWTACALPPDSSVIVPQTPAPTPPPPPEATRG